MVKYSSKNGRRRKNQKKHTKRKLRRGKSRKVMMGGVINKLGGFYGGSLPRLLTMDNIFTLLTEYDTRTKRTALNVFKKAFLLDAGLQGNIEEIEKSTTQQIEKSPTLQTLPGKTTNTDGTSMYSLSRLRELKFSHNDVVNVALFEHPYTLEEIVEIMFNLKTFSDAIIDRIPDEPKNNYPNLKKSFSKKDEREFKTEVTDLLNNNQGLVKLFNDAIRKYHHDVSMTSYAITEPITRQLLGDYQQ